MNIIIVAVIALIIIIQILCAIFDIPITLDQLKWKAYEEQLNYLLMIDRMNQYNKNCITGIGTLIKE